MLKHVHRLQSRYTAECIFTDSINTTHASVQGDFKITSARVFPLKKIDTKKPSLPFSLYCVHRNRFQLRQPEAPFFESVRAKKLGYFNRNKPFFRGEQNQYNACLFFFNLYQYIFFARDLLYNARGNGVQQITPVKIL